MRANTVIIDRGWQRIVRELSTVNGTSVYIGIPAGSSSARYAAINEFGGKGTPARPFMRSSFDETQRAANAQFDRLIGQVYRGNRTFNSVSNAMGTMMRDAAKRKVESDVPPPNAPGTVRQKGHGRTLIQTRAMLNQIRFYVRTVRGASAKGRAQVRWRLGDMR